MAMELKSMVGEELLLVSVLSSSRVQTLVDCELDRRALFGRVATLKQTQPWVKPIPRHAA